MEQIAIVGIGCRFPGGVVDALSFEDFLRRGGDAIGPVPSSRWPVAETAQPRGGFLADVDSFDASYFHIGATEAGQLDPQQRILLEVASDALNDAGIPGEGLRGSETGVFIGIYNNDYRLMAMGNPAGVNSYTGMGTIHALAANRLSYFFDLRGPSIAVDATCASSLVAVHLACQSLALGESNVAIAGGVNLILSPLSVLSTSLVVAPAADSRCKTFDSRADGIVRSEGCGAVILKRADDARRDGDRIYALLLATGVNQDGRSNGLSAPNPEAQENLIRGVLTKAGVRPESIGYFEAHGTGTALGDPIEAEAIGRVLRHPLLCGSVKTNLGHMEAASGVAGLIKTALQIHSGFIAPHLHLRSIHPLVAENAPNLRIPAGVSAWKRGAEPRRAAVSAFSLGGTNAHAILEEAPLPEWKRVSESDPRRPLWLTISGAEAGALNQAAADWSAFLRTSPLAFESICYTAAARRQQHAHRLAVLANNSTDAAEGLSNWLEGKRNSTVTVVAGIAREQPLLAFAFSGQGADWRGAGVELLETEPVFRSLLESAAATVNRLGGWRLLDVIREGLYEQTEYGQAAVFALQAAFLALLRSWGVRPDAVIGHSLGEVTAAYAAEVITLDEALRLLVPRGLLSQTLGVEGGMAAVRLAEDEARNLAAGLSLSIACRNSHSSVTVAGTGEAIREFAARAKRARVSCSVLRANRPFHSAGMERAARQFEFEAGPITTAAPSIPWYSTVTGALVEYQHLQPSHWRKNLSEPVRFAEASRAMLEDGYTGVVEFSPYSFLGRYLRETSAAIPDAIGGVWPLLAGPRNQTRQVRELLCHLYASGCEVAWDRCFDRGAVEVVSLPGYPWQRKKYWLSGVAPAAASFGYQVEWTAKRWLPAQVYDEAKSDIDRLCGSYCRAALAGLEAHPLAARIKEIAEFASPIAPGDLIRQHPELTAELSLLRRCGEALPEILSGRVNPVDIVFSGAEPAAIYRDSPFARHFHPLLADQLLNEVRRRSGKQIRILEAGAGTGGATSVLIPLLAGVPGLRYLMTDKSRAFLASARQEFGVYPWVEFGTLDLDQDCEQQGWEPASFDLIIASNALHAAKDVRRAVAGLRTLARSTGALLLLEGTGNRCWADLTFGLTQGWAGFADPEIRGNGPLVEVARWPEVLESAGWLGPAQIITGPGVEAAVICVSCERAPQPQRSWLLVGKPPVDDGLTAELRRAGDCVEERRNLSQASGGASVVFFQSDDPFSDPASPDALSLIRLLSDVSTRVEETRVWVVTRNAELSLSQSLNTGCGQDDLAGATLRGIARVFATEQPDRWGGLIDLDATSASSGILLAHVLLRARALAQSSDASEFEDRIGVRQGRIYAPRLVRDSSEPALVRLDPNGPCLITGGTGGVGAHVARWLVGQGVRHLVLASKRGASHPDATTLAGELRRAGATLVDIVALDVADRAQVEDLVQRYTNPPLRAVFHTAGVVADGTIPAIRESDLREVMSAKALGAWNLHTATAGLELSHFVLFSSAVTVLGMAGLAAYTAANEFLNELASMRRAVRLPAQSIAWSGWNNTGMAASAGAARVHQWKTLGLEPLSVADGLRGLDAAVASSAACLAWMDVRWDQYLSRFPRGRVPAFFSAFAKAVEEDPKSQAAGHSAASHDEQSIRAFIAGQIRGLACGAGDELADEDSLFDLGIDSLMAVELRNALSRELNVNLWATALFDYPVFGDLVQYLCKEAGVETESARAERMLETLSDSELRTLELSLTGGRE